MSLLSRINPMRVLRMANLVPQLQRQLREIGESSKSTSRQLRTLSRQLEEISAQLAAQQKLVDEIPEIRSRVRQALAMARYDERQAGRANGNSLDNGCLGREIRAAVARTELLTDPFPHLEIRDLIPQALYQELVASLPARMFFEHLPANRQELRVPFEYVPAYTREVWHKHMVPLVERELLPALIEKFKGVLDDRIKASWPDLGAGENSGLTFTILNSRLLLRLPGYEIKPHRDPRWAFITCLIYLPKAADTYIYGTQLYRLNHDREAPSGSPFWLDYGDCQLVKSVQGTAQSALAFINWSGAHSASIPADAPAGTQRYLYQVQFGPDPASRERLIAHTPSDRRTAWASKADY